MSKKYMNELKVCPFCGSNAKLFGPDKNSQWAIVCQHPECLCNVRLLYCNSKNEAVIQWNTRYTIEQEGRDA